MNKERKEGGKEEERKKRKEGGREGGKRKQNLSQKKELEYNIY